ncbi:hypothetical protein Nmel_000750 [Mimus melanotis]
MVVTKFLINTSRFIHAFNCGVLLL